MKIRLYLDEDSMRKSLVEALKSRQVDVITALDAGMLSRSDEEHLEYAASQNRGLYSFNVQDYNEIHRAWCAQGKTHAGIILCPQRKFGVGAQLRRLLMIASSVTAEQMVNRLEFLTNWKPKGQYYE